MFGFDIKKLCSPFFVNEEILKCKATLTKETEIFNISRNICIYNRTRMKM